MEPSRGIVAAACVGAVPVGIATSILAFEAFSSVYQYAPLLDIVVLLNFALLYGAFTALSGLARENAQVQVALALGVALVGVGLGVYGFAYWKLSSFSLVIFPPVSVLAFLMVRYSGSTVPPGDVRRAGLLALLATAVLLVPSLVLLSGLLAEELLIDELRRRVAIAVFLSLAFSSAMLGLGVTLLKKGDQQTTIPAHPTRWPHPSLAAAPALFGRLTTAYLAMAVYLYAHILGDLADRTLLILYLLAIHISMFVFPVIAWGFVTYKTWRAIKGVVTPAFLLSFALPGIVIAALPFVVLVAGAPAMDGFLWLVLYLGPVGPLLPLLAASVALSQGELGGSRLLPLVLFVAFVPPVAMWTSVLVSGSPPSDVELKDDISTLFGGAGGRSTVFHELAPLFVVYLAAGAALLAVHLGSKGRIDRSASLAPGEGVRDLRPHETRDEADPSGDGALARPGRNHPGSSSGEHKDPP